MKWALLLVALVACGGDDDDDDDDSAADAGDPTTVELRGECAADQRLGAFTVEAGPDLSSVAGKVENKPQPASIREEIAAEGGCRLLRRENPFCDPACQGTEVCDQDSTCVPQPEPRDVGVVTVDGLLVEVEMTPVPPGYNYFETQLPHPAFDAGALVTRTSTDGVYGELEMHGVGPQPLVIVGEEWDVEDGIGLAVSWEPPVGEVRTSVHLELNIDQHGATPVTLVCELDDTGSATVSGTLTDALFTAGISGFPRGSLSRRTADSQDVTDGCIELMVASSRTQSVVVIAP